MLERSFALIATKISSLLPSEDMVVPEAAFVMAVLIAAMLQNRPRECTAALSLKTARAYEEEILRERQVAFYRVLKEQT